MKNKISLVVLSLVIALIIAACGSGTDGPEFDLNVSVTGEGVVTSNVGGINCGDGNNDCTATFEESTSVTLSASPVPESWGGDCAAATGDTCTLTVNGRNSVDVLFDSDADPTDTPDPTDDPTEDPTEDPTDDPTGPIDDPTAPATDCDAAGTSCTDVADQLDDAEESTEAGESNGTPIAAGQVLTGSSDLEINYDENRAGGVQQIVGIRFADAGADIPDGSTPTSAYIEFTTEEEEDDGELTVIIEIEDADAPLAFSTAPFDISSRSYAVQTVTWDLTGDANNWPDDEGKVRSPNLISLLEAIGWAPGDSVVFKISTDDANPTAYRRAESAGEDNPPRLVVTY